MIKGRFSDLNKVFNSSIKPSSSEFLGVISDTRKDCTGAVFIALQGEQFDGHDYVTAAYQKGAVAAIVSQKVNCDITQIVVNDTLVAYGQLANFWRQQLNPTVIAITGSNGKTTVKEMLNSILKLEHTVLATKGNLNNEIGVPQTLCELSADDEIAIIEMGANHAGEIKRLSAIAEPDVVYVNNASATHIEGFGSLSGVQQAKGELYRFAKHNAIALINVDDDAAEQWQASVATQNVITLSLDKDDADMRALFKDEQLYIKTPNDTFRIKLGVKGQHNHSNALAAAGLALAVNASPDSIVKALSQFSGFKGRLQFVHGFNGSTIIDDSYNANPTSLKAGINVLTELQGEAWLAMGDMAELGENAQQEHDNIVEFAQHAGVKALFTKGKMSNCAAQKMQNNAHTFDAFKPMAEAMKQGLNDNINVLVKGSRSAKMEELVHLLERRHG